MKIEKLKLLILKKEFVEDYIMVIFDYIQYFGVKY